jgi:hypothetical protein
MKKRRKPFPRSGFSSDTERGRSANRYLRSLMGLPPAHIAVDDIDPAPPPKRGVLSHLKVTEQSDGSGRHVL